MTHRFPIKEIARQAGLGTATVDRVLNARAHVSPQTKARVQAAMAELEAQEFQLSARGRRLFFDLLVEAPNRFSREIKTATEAILPEIGAAVCRPRFLLQESMEEDEVIAALSRIQKRGSSGICLKARDTPKIRQAVARLAEARIPVVTLVTDIATDRITYVGLENTGAGRTAAYLTAQTLGAGGGTVLTTRSHERFLGEEEREAGFIAALRERRPDLRIVSVQGGSGTTRQTPKVIGAALEQIKDLRAVYSMGGGNRAILATLDDYGMRPHTYIAHDLDRENRELIAAGRIDFVMYHDLRTDMRRAFNAFMAYHRLAPEQTGPTVSTVQVITRENLPQAGEGG